MRRESWGLLFYSQSHHRLAFVKSGRWLFPEHLTGSWKMESLVKDIARRTDMSAEHIEPILQKLMVNLSKNGMIVNELC